MLGRKEPGGRVNFPDWLDDNFYIELTVETRDPKKGWVNPRKFRNESWDLLAYYVACTLTRNINLEHLDWGNPPGWAREWDCNDLVFRPEVAAMPFERKPQEGRSLASLAENLA